MRSQDPPVKFEISPVVSSTRYFVFKYIFLRYYAYIVYTSLKIIKEVFPLY